MNATWSVPPGAHTCGLRSTPASGSSDPSRVCAAPTRVLLSLWTQPRQVSASASHLVQWPSPGAEPAAHVTSLLRLYFYLLIFFKNCHILDLQCCVPFRCMAKRFHFIYIFVYSFSDSFLSYNKILNIVPYAMKQVYFIYSSCVSVNPKLLIYPSPTFPLDSHKFVFYVCNYVL